MLPFTYQCDLFANRYRLVRHELTNYCVRPATIHTSPQLARQRAYYFACVAHTHRSGLRNGPTRFVNNLVT